MTMFAAIWTTISLVVAAPADAACRDLVFEDIPFTVCTVEPSAHTIRLFLNDANGTPLGTFDNVENGLDDGETLLFAMNAGMYHSDRSPVGLYVEDSRDIGRLVTRDGPGNFGLLPNGVLCLNETRADVIESRQFDASGTRCRYATQSGPMLVIDGALHPRFLPNSDSRFVRNGVGVTETGTLVAAISNRPVNFHHFARLFRDVLDTPNALYMDGKVSRLYAPELGRHDFGLPMGPILGVIAPAD